MSTRFWFDEEIGCCFFEVKGVGLISQSIDASTAIYKDPRFKPGTPAIWDLREADLTAITAAQSADSARTIAANKQVRGDAKVALVVGSKLSYGMVRLFLAYSSVDYLTREIFYDMDDAIEWVRER